MADVGKRERKRPADAFRQTESVDAAKADLDRQAEAVGEESPPRLPFPVVGIGASAGGLEAFIEFFEAMPTAEPGMAFVLIQHLPPDRESMIAEILAKHTSLPVHQVDDGMPVERNHVYVIRPGKTLTIKDGKLHLGESLKTPGHNRPVDDFFRSLAEEQRERSIAIILSGMGSNGSQGAETIKAVGGVAIAQDPETAKYPSMPRHLMDSGNADYVLAVNEMPAVIGRYASHPYVSGDLTNEIAIDRGQKDLGDILAVLRTRTRRDFRGYKKPTILRRVYRRMGLHQIVELSDYAKFLRHTAAEVSALSDDLMIHVTGFFRDIDTWDSLQKNIIQPLVSRTEDGSKIRCWVSACATGEEAYTLSMLLLEAADAVDKTFDIKIFATDTADRALARARLGIYPMGIESEVSPRRLEQFFDRDDSTYRIKKQLREVVIFAPQNVVQDPPFSKLDICTCRNLLIYLEPELQRRVLALLHFGLREGGALMLGTSETVAGAENLFEAIDKKARIFRRIGKTPREAIEVAFGAATAATKPTIGQLTNFALLSRYTPASATVDREGQIVFLHGETNDFLKQPPGAPTKDLLAMVDEDMQNAVRAALYKSMADRGRTTARGPIIETPNGKFYIQVIVAPLNNDEAPGHSLVSFERHEDGSVSNKDSEILDTDDARAIKEHLRRTRDELQTTIEELQTSNEEMKASAEEAMSVNEELQSTNEELQTSKEELQSLNEELTTVNAQLEAKMDELEATTNDLGSLLSSTDIAVVFLDTRMRIRRFTPAIADLIDLIPSDIGRPVKDMARKFDDPDLLADCQRVLDRLIPIEKEVRSAAGRVYMQRILPYRTTDNRIDGVVITYLDISKLRRAETALDESEQRFRLVLENAPDFAIVLADTKGRIITWNVGAERLLGWSAAEAVGKNVVMIYPPETAQAQSQGEMDRAAEFGRAADEGWHVRKSGARFWGSGVLTAVRDADRQLTGFVKVLRDDTSRKQAETERGDLLKREQAARAEAENTTRLKDQFLAVLSHELRTPISSILIWARMLRENLCDPSEREEGMEVIEKSAEAQKQLLDDLLDVSRIASGKTRLERSDADLHEVVQLAIDSLLPTAKSKGVTVKTNLATSVGTISADPDRLRQVVGNLVNNAVKFTPSGGSVDVRLRRDGEWIELSVSDTGKGIEPEFLPHVFTAFSQSDVSSTRSFGGLGLGLAISKELVELHGGTIHAESEGAGKGASFVVRLPSSAPDKLAKRKVRKRGSNGSRAELTAGTKILLVEDEPHSREAIERLLEKSGAVVRAAGTAAEAFAAFEKSRPDIIISDVGLPEEDGYALLQRIRTLEMERQEPPTPAIALTAFASNKDRRHARESGFHKHIAKPVTAAMLLAAVVTLLEDKDHADDTE